MSTSAPSLRPSKRARQALVPASPAPTRSPALFAPFRSLGHISTSVPFALLSRSNKFADKPSLTVLTSLGKSWALWEGEGLRLLFVGPTLDSLITSLALSPDSIFSSWGLTVGRYVRGKEVGRFVVGSDVSTALARTRAAPSDDDSEDEDDSMEDGEDEEEVEEKLVQLTLFGSTMVALSSLGTRMFIWDLPVLVKAASAGKNKVEEEDDVDPVVEGPVTPFATLSFPKGFKATTLVHPASYLNKIVIGSDAGELAVWNVRTGTLLHTFPASTFLSLSSSSTLSPPRAITSLVQSPALDVLAVALCPPTGSKSIHSEVVLFDVRLGEVLGRIALEESLGTITSVGFRSDDEAQTLAVATSAGHLVFFDLTNKLRLLHITRNAHDGAVAGMQYVAGEGVLFTNSGDNSVKQWVFDSPTAPARLLKQRSGHRAPIRLVRYYGEDGKALLTAGEDRALRYISVVRDSRGYELSQGSIAKKASNLGVSDSSLKLPVIKSIAFSTARSKDWDDVVTYHEGESMGRSWSVDGKRMGKWTLKTDGVVTTTAVTACGNFGLVGSDAGVVVSYNLQSGLKRKVFNVPSGGATDTKGRHVTGVATDALNRVLIVSTLKGGIYLFDFQTMTLRESIVLPANITSIVLHRENGLLAVTCDDLTVRIIDIETRRIVRELSGFRGAILDLAFSPDSRWIITTSQDSIIRTFDIPTGQLIDAFRTESVATSLAYSPTADFLATCHVDSVGVYLWANRAQFSEVSLKTFVEEDLEAVALPTMQLSGEEGLEGLPQSVNWDTLQPYTTPSQLTFSLLTLSLMPRTKWMTLLNLETIKQRNKPIAPPKLPERAPFFLPTLPGVDNRFDFGGAEKKQGKEEGASRRLQMGSQSVETDFIRRLSKEDPTGDYQAFYEYLKALSPSSTDLEFRSLSTLPHLTLFLNSLSARLASHRDFEAVQSYLAHFLRIHGDVLVANEELKVALERVEEEGRKGGERVRELVGYCLGTLAFLRGVSVA